MKKEQVKQWFRQTKVKIGSIMMATVVLFGSTAWYENTQTTVPELVTFVDVEESVTITEEEVPLAAPKVTKSTKTKKSTKKVKMKTAAKKNLMTKGKTYKKTTTKKVSSTTKDTTTKTEVSTFNTYKYKKGSKIRTDTTTVKTTITKTVVTRTTASKTSTAKTTASKTASTAVNSTATLASYTSKVDSRVLNAYNKLGFKTSVNANVSYSGLFDARTRSITLKKVDATILHELGHFVAFLAGNVDMTSEFKQVYNTEKSKYTEYNKNYILSSSSEYFAESFKNYTENPAALKASRPQTYAAIQSALNRLTDSQISKVWNTYKVIWEK